MQKHALVKEFPTFEEKINNLKLSHNHFKKLFDEYDDLNSKIENYEEDDQNHTTDEHLNKLRIDRLKLKDEIHHFLQMN